MRLDEITEGERRLSKASRNKPQEDSQYLERQARKQSQERKF